MLKADPTYVYVTGDSGGVVLWRDMPNLSNAETLFYGNTSDHEIISARGEAPAWIKTVEEIKKGH
jgi:hypothetical protein